MLRAGFASEARACRASGNAAAAKTWLGKLAREDVIRKVGPPSHPLFDLLCILRERRSVRFASPVHTQCMCARQTALGRRRPRVPM
jgi:hypothetical protein